MKKKTYLPALLLPIGIMALLLQGCYTQVATIREEEPSYRQEEQSSQQSDSSTYYNDYDNWQPHNYIGFSYYYPGWRSYWAWDYGCVYPTFWDPWYWGPAYYAGYSYYPHYWGYWNSYPRYSHWGYGGHFNSSRPFAMRNTGYQRSWSSRNSYGVARSTPNGNVGSGVVRGGVTLPRDPGTATQIGRSRNSRSGNSGVSTSRQPSSGRYNPSVQQPRHRDPSAATTGRSYRTGSSHGRENYRNQGSSNGQSRSSQRNSAPSYSPQPPARTSSAPSAPAPRNDGGGGRQSSGSGRSNR